MTKKNAVNKLCRSVEKFTMLCAMFEGIKVKTKKKRFSSLNRKYIFI